MDQTEIYDEFGNYIGTESESNLDLEISLDEDEDRSSDSQKNPTYDPTEVDDVKVINGINRIVDGMDIEMASEAIILHEHKEYYEDADKIFGKDVEILFEDEDMHHIDTPTIVPLKDNKFDLVEGDINRIQITFSYDYMKDMMKQPKLIRNVAIVGDLHHGKTSLIDMLIRITHKFSNLKTEKLNRYTDSRIDEQEREISIKATPISLILPNSINKSYLLNIIDTPGHVNFMDEFCASIRLCDGVVIVVDAILGISKHTERMIYYCLREKQDIVLLINKIDRLILELRIPPNDAYCKLGYIINEANEVIKSFYSLYRTDENEIDHLIFSPEKGNVGFASGKFGFCFTLQSFARMYLKEPYTTTSELMQNIDSFCNNLWGDLYYSKSLGKFLRSSNESTYKFCSFVQFILEPLYKIFIYSLSEQPKVLSTLLPSIGVYLSRSELKKSPTSILDTICKRFFGGANAFTDLIVKNISNPLEASPIRTFNEYTGPQNDLLAQRIRNLSYDSPAVAFVTKHYHTSSMDSFYSLCRVYCGILRKGDVVKVLGESYTAEDPEDMSICTIQNIWIFQARYKVEISEVPAGNWALISGLNNSVIKTATIICDKARSDKYNNNKPYKEVDELSCGNIKDEILIEDKKNEYLTQQNNDLHILRPLKFPTNNVIRLACEPVNPSELPKMLEGLKSLDKAYPILKTKVEESGEHVIFGTGELQLDCIMHDLRRLYGNLDVKVSDPSVQLCETVLDTSVVKSFGDSSNKQNRIYIIAEPLEKGLAEDIENGIVKFYDCIDNESTKYHQQILKDKYNWDHLALRSLWAFGPTFEGANVLIDDTLSSITDKKSLYEIKENIVQGFQWATREGPLLEENVRNVKFKILDVSLASNRASRGTGQIIPAARRACYTAMLMASPRLMEPICLVEIICPSESHNAIANVLLRRRGHCGKENPIPGTPLVTIYGFIPAIESFGFETDLRVHTSGQAFCSTCFDHWALVPGNPLDRNIILRPLEPAPIPHLAREFLLKTRRRKGLSEDVSVRNFIDSPQLLKTLNN
ncbi:U5 small nuclear ribonucleoprotein subunit [Cryptosporidium andersoni]|uniref:116 kDa U5 small nuclear ribonucleoprotein component n=1 Tax=Cryptosporidium andersoni TaxID=117008 RepID=A0A1J4MR96_9CRYT|nr:U5 small nuclear ribonucleoprotein subunit [Cryptosporidium andersoni]